MIEILSLLLKAIITIAVPVLTAIGTTLAGKYVEIKTEEIKDARIRAALQEGANILFNSVNYVNQTYVEELKKQDKFDKEAQQQALAKAKNVAMDLMSAEIKKVLALQYDDVDKYMTTFIESYIAQQKLFQKEG